jgi:hypothetical protein
MSHQIDPLILQKLRAFARRRRRLILFRGICAAVATLLLTMMLIALLDRLVRLPDGVRWALSLTAYAAVIVVEWRACVRLLLHSPDPRRLARLIEHAEPKLREDLLSAVELGDSRSNPAFDSEQFRALLQSDVARRMEGLSMEKLLPMNLLRRYTGVAALIALACVAAFILSGGQFGTLLLRAFAPGANLDRVSRVKVRIVEPHSPEQLVAQGETIPLIIETSGQRTHSAQVELITQGRGERVKMTPVGPDRFSATIQVGREDVLYRVYAGDAVTRKYRLQTVARPHVIAFEKHYVPPAYLNAAARTVTEENGDLVGPEGSEVELRLKTNQPVRSAELRIQQGNETLTVPLTADGQTLVGRVALQTSGTYRVALTAAATGFENKFSPEYALRAEPDLLPQIELTLPKQDLILAANEIVDVEGTASDDQALADVSQLVKINEGKWQTKSLAQQPGAKAGVSRRWDLFEQGVRAGDLVTTKLVATDLKGNRSESRSLQVTITQAGFETNRLETLEAQRQLYDLLVQLRASAETLEKRSKEAREKFDRLPENDPQRTQVIVDAKSVAQDFAFKTSEVWTVLTTVLKNGRADGSTAGLVQL